MSAEAGIAAFWAWWSDGGAERTQEFVAGEVEHDLAAEIAPLVAAIHPGLQWELALGERSRHTFVVTAAGDPALRATARAWLRAAPAPTVLWGYDDLRRPRLDVADSVFEFAGHRVAMGDFVVAAHLRDTSIDVGVHHPVFLDVGDNEAAQLTYLALDGFLGEEAVETWLGEVTWPAERPLDGFPLQHLPGWSPTLRRAFAGRTASHSGSHSRASVRRALPSPPWPRCPCARSRIPSSTPTSGCRCRMRSRHPRVCRGGRRSPTSATWRSESGWLSAPMGALSRTRAMRGYA